MAVAAALRKVPGVGRHMLVEGAAVEEGRQVNHVDLAGRVAARRDIVEEAVVRARRTIAEDTGPVEDAEKVLHMVDVVGGIDLVEVRRRAVVVDNPEVVDSSLGPAHNLEEAQKEHHAAVGILVANKEAVDSLAEESLGGCK